MSTRKTFCMVDPNEPAALHSPDCPAYLAFHERLAARNIAPNTAAGMTPLMPGGESTSAMLRQVQADLAASQADLTRAERERDQANELTDKIAAELRGVTKERDSLARRCAVRFEAMQALCAELVSARLELEQLRAARHWIVARDGGRWCERCEHEIRRGEAHELVPLTDALRHVRCPDEPDERTHHMKFRKRPVVVEAIRWTGDNAAQLNYFAASHFDVLDEQDRANSDDPEATAQIFDTLHSTWVLVQTGDWIIRGVQGEFYPCRTDVFEATYEPADVRMAPDEHYACGQSLLKGCEQLAEVDHAAAASQAVIAQAHFGAAASGMGMRAFEAMTHPVQQVDGIDG